MVKIFENIDCMEGMVKYADLLKGRKTLAIVDPPYGICAASKTFIRYGLQTGRSKTISGLRYKPKSWDNKRPDRDYFNTLFSFSKNQIVWGVNFFNDFRFGHGRVVWDKDNSENKYSDCEIAYQSLTDGVRRFKYKWHGMLQQDMKNKELRIHPSQKPVALYRWLLKNYGKDHDLILDTHVGSASSLIACEIEGFEYIGFELDTDYYRDAKARLERETAQVDLFKPEKTNGRVVEQGVLL